MSVRRDSTGHILISQRYYSLRFFFRTLIFLPSKMFLSKQNYKLPVLHVKHLDYKHSTVACVAVVSVSFKPSGVSARGHWGKRSKKVRERRGGEGRGRKGNPPRPSPPLLLFCSFLSQCPRALTPLGLKETETTATQANSTVSKMVTR